MTTWRRVLGFVKLIKLLAVDVPVRPRFLSTFEVDSDCDCANS